MPKKKKRARIKKKMGLDVYRFGKEIRHGKPELVLPPGQLVGFVYEICCDCGLRHSTFYFKMEDGAILKLWGRDNLGTDLIRVIKKSKLLTKRNKERLIKFLKDDE